MFLLCQIKISHARPLLWPHLTTLTCWTHAFLWPQLLTSDRTAQVFWSKFINLSFVLEFMYFSIARINFSTTMEEKCPMWKHKKSTLIKQICMLVRWRGGTRTVKIICCIFIPMETRKWFAKNYHAICTLDLQLDACLLIRKGLENYCRLSLSFFAFIGWVHIIDTSN